MINDGGIKSRKLWFAVGTALAIILSSKFVPVGLYPEAVSGLTIVLGIYVGGNAGVKFLGAKFGSKLPPPDDEPVEEPKAKKGPPNAK
jgi:hypothetical protein